MKKSLFIIGVGLLLTSCVKYPSTTDQSVSSSVSSSSVAAVLENHSSSEDLSKLSDAQWKQRLTPEQYHILREQGTEVPFTSPLDFETESGVYLAADTLEPIFSSAQKYDSGTGWPSFWAPILPDAIQTKEDTTLGMTRVEVLTKAGGHLGHVFEDGPQPTGLRYCMNGDALIFVPQAEWEKMRSRKP